MNPKRKMLLFVLFSLLMILIEHHFRNDQLEEPELSTWFDSKKRPDVITKTDWLAPIIWEGTYNRQVLEKYYKKLNITIGLAVFATGKFADHNLKQFLQSAEKYFMVGFNVIFYIFLEDITKIPYIELGPLRTFKLLPLVQEQKWEDLHLKIMKNLNVFLIDHIQHEVDFVFIMAINQIFKNDFGVETLGRSVAQLHSWWYLQKTQDFPYERSARSAAFIPFGQGDFYYHSAIFGGASHEVLAFINQIIEEIDTTNELNSLFESHLNKYFFVNKPTKLLSPEYNWDPNFKTPLQIKHVKIAWQSEMTG